MHRLRSFCIAALMITSLGMLTGCDTISLPAAALRSDFEEATLAIQAKEWAKAEKLLERYLRTATDPQKRWAAWKELVEVSEHTSPDQRWTVDYLETMLVEFGDDPERLRHLLTKLGELQETGRRFERAAETWQQLISVPQLPPQDSAKVHQRLAHLQVTLGRLQDAGETLHECLSLPLDDVAKSPCLYALAGVRVLQDDLDDGATIALQITDQPSVPQEIRTRAIFLLADIREVQGKNIEALALFESIKDTYPNPMVVEARIGYLKRKR